jgi:hypothetical protein
MRKARGTNATTPGAQKWEDIEWCWLSSLDALVSRSSAESLVFGLHAELHAHVRRQ